MADTKLTALSAGSPALASLVYGVDDPAGTPASVKYTIAQIMSVTRSGLTYTAGGANADQAMAVNTLYYVDISGYSADRTYTLPATAAVGDTCAITLTSGDADFELIITANTGDTLDGVAGGTEWSRLFITGETVYMMCTAANAAWSVVVDRRIPQFAKMRLSTQADGESANTVSLPTDFGGAWTLVSDNASLSTTGTGRITVRRAGYTSVVCTMRAKDNLVSGGIYYSIILQSSTERSRGIVAPGTTVTNAWATTTLVALSVVDEFYQGAFASAIGGLGVFANSSVHFSVTELLNGITA